MVIIVYLHLLQPGPCFQKSLDTIFFKNSINTIHLFIYIVHLHSIGKGACIGVFQTVMFLRQIKQTLQSFKTRLKGKKKIKYN